MNLRMFVTQQGVPRVWQQGVPRVWQQGVPCVWRPRGAVPDWETVGSSSSGLTLLLLAASPVLIITRQHKTQLNKHKGCFQGKSPNFKSNRDKKKNICIPNNRRSNSSLPRASHGMEAPPLSYPGQCLKQVNRQNKQGSAPKYLPILLKEVMRHKSIF